MLWKCFACHRTVTPYPSMPWTPCKPAGSRWTYLLGQGELEEGIAFRDLGVDRQLMHRVDVVPANLRARCRGGEHPCPDQAVGVEAPANRT